MSRCRIPGGAAGGALAWPPPAPWTWSRLTFANALAGNPPETAALEFAHVGGAWEITAESCRIAVTGGDFKVTCDDAPLASWQSHVLRRGQRLMIGGAPDAVWGYLAVAGGFDVKQRLGSRATHLRSGLGGMDGRLLAAGDALPLLCTQAADGSERRVFAPGRPRWPLRVVLGPQQDFFDQDVIEFIPRRDVPGDAPGRPDGDMA